MGCIAFAPFIPPPSSVHTTDALPPAPPPSQDLPTATLETEGVTMDAAAKQRLSELAAERDLQLQRHTPADEWRNLFDRAKQLFRDAALPQNLARILTSVFAVKRIQAASCETVLAKVIAAAQTKGYEAAV